MFRSRSVYFPARLFAAGLSLFAIVFYAHLLDAEALGTYALTLAGVGFANLTLFVWLRVGVVRSIPDKTVRPGDIRTTAVWVWAALAVGCGLVALATGSPFVRWGAAALVVLAWAELMEEWARATLAHGVWLASTLLRPVACLVTGFILIVPLQEPQGAIQAFVIGNALVGSGVAVWLLRTWPRGRFRRDLLVAWVRYGGPMAVSLGVQGTVTDIDKVLLGSLHTVGTVGHMAPLYDISRNAVSVVVQASTVATFPVATVRLEQQKAKAAHLHIQKGANTAFLIGLVATGGLVTVGPFLFSVVLPGLSPGAAERLILPVALASVLNGWKSCYFDQAFLLGRNTRPKIGIELAYAVTTAAVSFVMIHRFGLYGCGWGPLAGAVVALCLSRRFGQAVFPLPLPRWT